MHLADLRNVLSAVIVVFQAQMFCSFDQSVCGVLQIILVHRINRLLFDVQSYEAFVFFGSLFQNHIASYIQLVINTYMMCKYIQYFIKKL